MIIYMNLYKTIIAIEEEEEPERNLKILLRK